MVFVQFATQNQMEKNYTLTIVIALEWKKKGGGYVRGLLCSNCNTSLGLLKDNINNLKKAIKYIMFHEKNPNFHKLKYSSSYFIKAKKWKKD